MEDRLSTLEVVQEYFDAWNRRDPAGIVAIFADGGKYNDPASGGYQSGQALVEYTSGLFPAHWILKGTNSGFFIWY